MWIADSPGDCFGKHLLLTWSLTKKSMRWGEKLLKVWGKNEGLGERMFCLPFDYVQLLMNKDNTENVARRHEKTSYSFALWKTLVWSHGEIPLGEKKKKKLNKIPLLIYFRKSWNGQILRLQLKTLQSKSMQYADCLCRCKLSVADQDEDVSPHWTLLDTTTPSIGPGEWAGRAAWPCHAFACGW